MLSENVYTKLLAQLAAKEGSTQAVASLLHVPERTMQRWMQGRAQMPLQAFLHALHLAVQHEQKGGPLPSVAPAPELIVLKAGTAAARCGKCGGHEFRRVDSSAPHTYRSLLACIECGAQAVHHELVSALAKEVARRAGRKSPT